MDKQEEMRKFESSTIVLPPIKMILGDIPTPNPSRVREIRKRIYTKEEIVRRLIVGLMEK
ncbi:MAG: hypothetical protein JXA13_05770 [Anaerolineales bacterium]|nr:hypothetical protein [Anaerolineales bacterium]